MVNYIKTMDMYRYTIDNDIHSNNMLTISKLWLHIDILEIMIATPIILLTISKLRIDIEIIQIKLNIGKI